MALDVTVAGTVSKKVVQTVNTDTVRITKVVFDFDNENIALEVTYGVAAGGFNPAYQELWIAHGQPLLNILQLTPTGSTRLAVFRHFIGDIVSRIQSDPTLKATLINDGNLIIKQSSLGSVFSF